MIPRRPGARSGRREDDRGAVALVVAAFMVVFLGLSAIVVDLGFARDRVRVAQNAADAAALAAAVCAASPASCNDPVDTAQHYITANGWTYDPSTVSVDSPAQAVTISLPRQPTPGFFAGGIGFSNPRIGATARATWGGAGGVTCALCVLGDFDGQVGAITLAGSLAVNGAIDFSNAIGTVTMNGPPGTGVFYHGTQTGGSYTVNGTAVAPVFTNTPIADPLTGLPMPRTGVEGVDLTVTAGFGPGGPSPVVCPPGNYIDFSRCDALQGNGIYIVTGPAAGGAIEIPGGTASNTLVYLTCNDGANKPKDCRPGQKGAYLGGNGRFTSTVNGRSAASLYAGYAVIYDRNNSPDRSDAKVSGNGVLTLNGNLYGASATVDFRGNGSLTVDGFAVVGAVTLSGRGAAANHIDVSASNGQQRVSAGIPPHLIP